MLTPKQRLTRQTLLQDIDAIPSIGGWMLNPRNLATIGGITETEYLADPFAGFIKANKALECDGIVCGCIVPDKPDIIRTGSLTEENFSERRPEDILADAEKTPDTAAEVLAGFNAEKIRCEYRDTLLAKRKAFAGMEPIPNFWEFGGPFPLYFKYGYLAFFEACALYPEAIEKIWWSHCVETRERAKCFVSLYKELDLVPLMFCGEDICNNGGPMASPEMLRQRYFPHVKMVTEPFVEAGVRMIYHCDGDVRPLVRDYLEVGYSGFQGFQYECGVDVRELRQLKPALGEKPLIFGGLSVTRTLPWGTPDDVRREVDYLTDATDGGRGLFLFTSNVTGYEVPAQNIAAGYRHAKQRPLYTPSPTPPRWQEINPKS